MSRPALAVPPRLVIAALLDLWERASPLRFLLIGALNTLFGYAAFLLGLAAGLPMVVALVASTAAGIAFNFQTARRLVFRSREPGRGTRFVLAYAAITAVDAALLQTLAALGLAPGPAQGILVLPLAGLSFALQRRFVFADSDRP